MATFSGGEEIVNVGQVSATSTTTLNYTVPAGRYSHFQTRFRTQPDGFNTTTANISIGGTIFRVHTTSATVTSFQVSDEVILVQSGITVTWTMAGGFPSSTRVINFKEFNNP